MRRDLLLRSASLLLAVGTADAEDLRLTDGTLLRGARVTEVRPDSLIVAHNRGVTMADFPKLPPGIRARYGYDAEKAAAYRKRQGAALAATVEESCNLIAAHEKRKMELARAQIEAASGANAPTATSGEINFSYSLAGADRAYAAAITQVAGEIAKAEEARFATERGSKIFWNAPFWGHPITRFLVGDSPITRLLTGGDTRLSGFWPGERNLPK